MKGLLAKFKERTRISGGDYEAFQRLGGSPPGYVLLQDHSPLSFARALLDSLDAGHVPIALPRSWPDTRVQSEHLRLGQVHSWKDGAFTASERPLAPPRELQNCYGAYSSGTTGRPRLSFFGVAGALENARAHAESLGISSSSRILQSLPLDHAFGLVAYIWTPLAVECSIEFPPLFDGWRTLELLKADHRSVVHLTPNWLNQLLRSSDRARSFPGTVSVGAAAARPEDLDDFLKLTRSELFVTYGLTEAGPRVSTGRWSSAPEPRSGYVGSPIRDVELAILKDDGSIAKSGEGTLLVRGPSLKVNPEPGELLRDYLITPDLARLSTSGDLVLKGRKTPSFKFKSRLIDLGGLRASAQAGETIAAALFAKNGREHWLLAIEAQELPSGVKASVEAMESALRPSEIRCLATFPRTSLGKVDLTSLHDKLGLPEDAELICV